MPLIIQRNDLAKMNVDAVVIPTNPWLEEGAGTSRAVYKAAGEDQLANACQNFGYVDYGKVVMTDGFALPAKCIIHAVVPIWVEGDERIPKQLYSCYKSALELAARSGLSTVAFPLLSSGRYRYPKDEAIKIANTAINDFLCSEKQEADSNDFVGNFSTEPSEMTVYLVVFDKTSVVVANDIYGEIEKFIDDRYVEDSLEYDGFIDDRNDRDLLKDTGFFDEANKLASPVEEAPKIAEPFSLKKRFTFAGATRALPIKPLELEEYSEHVAESISNDELDQLIAHQTETFKDALYRFANESGKSNPEIYNDANISKQLFSKIISDNGYTPKKTTIFALAIGLNLNIEDTKYLLMKAGYAFSDSSKQDLIVEYFIEHRIYNMFDINTALFNFDEGLLGSSMI